MSDGFHVVAATSELPEGGQMLVELDGEEILLCHHEGQYYAVAFYCSHEAFGLEGGEMHEGCITCPYHGAEFKLADGSVLAPPAFEGINTYPLRVEDDLIKICATPQPPGEA
ncbi:MAG: Rieske 2Fe-2S domain-containing protein [Pseudomonadales bacterium]|nr:Rieske 2Fe-2S domain-containing protein [Pseudomonadales bacterium]